jgi:hypothetical protein
VVHWQQEYGRVLYTYIRREAYVITLLVARSALVVMNPLPKLSILARSVQMCPVGVQVDYNVVHLRTSLVQSFVLLFQNFEQVVQIIALKRFGDAPNGYPFAPLVFRQAAMGLWRRELCAKVDLQPWDHTTMFSWSRQ